MRTSSSQTSGGFDLGSEAEAGRAHPITLRFASPRLEAAFTEEYQRASMGHIRFAVAMGFFLVAAFGILDAVIQPAVTGRLWRIRYGVICPYVLFVFVLTFVSAARPYLEWALASMLLVSGGGIIGMILLSPPPGRYFYYAGLILVIMYLFTFVKLRFIVATVLGWGMVAMYFVAEAIEGRTPWPILTNNLFFFVSATGIGMFAAYFLETLARRNFVQARMIRRARAFGSYRLVAPLGHGGMGEVWRAEHRFLARPAAVKVIRPEMLGAADDEERRATLRRFEREAQATALLRSPHTIQLYDFGVTDEGAFYYVMELLEGFDLETLVERFGPLPWPRAVHLLGQLCDSLSEAHERGMIHRDIKPANVYVCSYGQARDFVKVLDFGLVKSREEPEPGEGGASAPGDSGATCAGTMAGTPSCMAPEQVTGDHPLDARTDLYGVGCVAYWMLTGGPVFEGATPWAVILQHMRDRPMPVSARAAQSIPPRLEAIVLACLEKGPDRRPASARALAMELASCRGMETWSEEDALAWWQEHAPAPPTEVRSAKPRELMPTLARGSFDDVFPISGNHGTVERLRIEVGRRHVRRS